MSEDDSTPEQQAAGDPADREAPDGEAPPSVSARKKARAVIGSVIGLGLFVAAIWTVATSDHDFEASWEAARGAPWWLFALVVVLPIFNWIVISESFRVLTRRYAPIRRTEMAGLIASAWLLNYLPMKPGMLGRLAYHKHVNGIRYTHSARILVFSVSLSGAALGMVVLVALLIRWLGHGWFWVSLPAVLLTIAAVVLRNRGPWTGRVVYGALMRYLDVTIWMARYASAFALVGAPLSFSETVTVTAVSQIALFIPISGNGLGVREWGVGLVTSPTGILADVVNRAAEVLMALTVGVAGTVWSVREIRKHMDSPAEPEQTEPDTAEH